MSFGRSAFTLSTVLMILAPVAAGYPAGQLAGRVIRFGYPGFNHRILHTICTEATSCNRTEPRYDSSDQRSKLSSTLD